MIHKLIMTRNEIDDQIRAVEKRTGELSLNEYYRLKAILLEEKWAASVDSLVELIEDERDEKTAPVIR